MKTTKNLVNENEIYNPCVVSILTGKYGEYAKMNGINYSLKKMNERGYEIKHLTNSQIEEIKEKNYLLSEKRKKASQENFMKKLTEISFTFKNGEKILSVSDFKNKSRNIGQETQGSDSHENLVFIDGEEVLAGKHWSNDGIGTWNAQNRVDYIGDIFFIDGKVFLKKAEK